MLENDRNALKGDGVAFQGEEKTVWRLLRATVKADGEALRGNGEAFNSFKTALLVHTCFCAWDIFKNVFFMKSHSTSYLGLRLE